MISGKVLLGNLCTQSIFHPAKILGGFEWKRQAKNDPLLSPLPLKSNFLELVMQQLLL